MTGPGVDGCGSTRSRLRCYIANLRAKTATYRGAVAFAHLIRLPGRTEQPGPPRTPAAADFVGTAKPR